MIFREYVTDGGHKITINLSCIASVQESNNGQCIINMVGDEEFFYRVTTSYADVTLELHALAAISAGEVAIGDSCDTAR